MKKVFKEVKGTTKMVSGSLKKKKEKVNELTIPNASNQPASNQQAQTEVQIYNDAYNAIKNYKQERANQLVGMMNEFNAMAGPPKKELTDKEIKQMQYDYFNSKAYWAVQNFRREIALLVKQHTDTAPEEVLTAAKNLLSALQESIKEGVKDYLVNQRELSLVENNLLSNSQQLIEQYSPAIEEDPSFFASFLRIVNYLFGCCMGTPFSTNTVFSDSRKYLDLKNSIFWPETKESPTTNETSSHSNVPNQ